MDTNQIVQQVIAQLVAMPDSAKERLLPSSMLSKIISGIQATNNALGAVVVSNLGDIDIPVGGVRVVIALDPINCIGEAVISDYTIPEGYMFAPCNAFAINTTIVNQEAFITELSYSDEGGRSVTNSSLNTNQENEINQINFELFQAQVSGGFLVAGQLLDITKPETIEASHEDSEYVISPFVEGILIKV